MSHTKIANKLQNLKSSAIRELLKHSKMDGVISLGGGIPDPNLFDREGLQIAMDHILTHGSFSVASSPATASPCCVITIPIVFLCLCVA